MKCPNCGSVNTFDRTDIYNETRQPAYDYGCEDCSCIFNDEEDYDVI